VRLFGVRRLGAALAKAAHNAKSCSKLLTLTAPPKGDKAMNKVVAVCLGVLMIVSIATSRPKVETFALADRIGEGEERSFFLFSTSAGNYVVRHDGMGEFSPVKGTRRVFNLKVGPKARIDRVYFLEHDRDLFLLYAVHDANSEWAYLTRMEQTQRKARWLTSLSSADVEAPVIEGDLVMIKDVAVSKFDGRVIRQD
jgi:hypothetical protein